MTRKFSKKFLQNLVWEDENEEGAKIVEDKIIENSRWAILHSLVFSFDDKYYSTSYRVGATEQQDERPFEYEKDEIECVEVIPKEKTIIEYVVK